MENDSSPVAMEDHCTTVEAARRLGMAVRSVQLMVDRGELVAWKTPGGHRRIANESVERWLAARRGGRTAKRGSEGPSLANPERVLLIEDSVHHQRLVALLLAKVFPDVELHIADDGIAGLAMYGRLLPDVLVVDILLPGIDGANLINSLKTHSQFSGSQLIVLTSLDAQQREPYALALEGVPIVHKPQLVTELPPLIERGLASRRKVGL